MYNYLELERKKERHDWTSGVCRVSYLVIITNEDVCLPPFESRPSFCYMYVCTTNTDQYHTPGFEPRDGPEISVLVDFCYVGWVNFTPELTL